MVWAQEIGVVGDGDEVEVVGHQAVAEQLKGVALFGGRECLEERDIIGVLGEDIRAVVPAIDRGVEEAIINYAV